jgi:serine/threonine-protein kinase
MVLGTPSFMSPEQMTGRRIDGRSDIYSLGVMLFQLLCGQLPHRADSMAALMSQIVNQRAPDIRSLRPELPAALADLVALTLEKRPELRHADGRQLALDLKLIATRMDGTSEPAPPPAMRREVDPFASTVKFSRDDPRHNPGE